MSAPALPVSWPRLTGQRAACPDPGHSAPVHTTPATATSNQGPKGIAAAILQPTSYTKNASGVLSALRKLRAGMAAGAEPPFCKTAVDSLTALCVLGAVERSTACEDGQARHKTIHSAGGANPAEGGEKTAEMAVEQSTAGMRGCFDLTLVKLAAGFSGALPPLPKPPIGRSTSAVQPAVDRFTAVLPSAAPPKPAVEQSTANQALLGPKAQPPVLAASTTRATSQPPGGSQSPSTHPIQSYSGLSTNPNQLGAYTGNAAFGTKNSVL